MCGLFSIVNRAGIGPADESWAASGRERLWLRGPDYQQTHRTTDGLCMLAHTRLSILDPSPLAHQPMVDPISKAAIVFNGEIYNFPDLRRSLAGSGSQFSSHSDTEVILQLYLREGIAGFSKLRGMYAFVIWDPRTRLTIAARDPFGIKPLYFWRDRERWVFASQVRAITLGLPNCTLDPDVALEFGLFGHVVGPQTPVKGITEVLPGSIVQIDASGVETTQRQSDLRVLYSRSDEYVPPFPEIAAALEESVGAHTLSDVPIGILLSTGTDSALVGSRLATSCDAASVKAFTIGFVGAGAQPYDERSAAAMIAHRLGFTAVSDSVTFDSVAADLDAFLEAMDSPSVDAVNVYFAAKLVREHGVKVALSGIGGDELFGGYPTFWRTPLLRSFPGQAGIAATRRVAALGIDLPLFNASKLDWMARCKDTTTGVYLVQRGLANPNQVAIDFDCDVTQVWRVFNRVHDVLEAELEGIDSIWSAVSYLETRFYLIPRLLKDADWASMAHSVELRTPLVDWALWRRILPYVRGLRSPRKSKRSLLEPIMAPGVADLLSKPKRGFSNPYEMLANVAQPGQGRGGRSGTDMQRWGQFILKRWVKSVGL
jgi:asparagine synthase (glutamine-hydrolysing)